MDNRTDKLGRQLDMNELQQVTGGKYLSNPLDHYERSMIKSSEGDYSSDENSGMDFGIAPVLFGE